MRIAIGSDHGGYLLKEHLKKWLGQNKLAFDDFGADGPASVDYPDFGKHVARAVVKGQYDFGIIICGTGIGISIAANKVKGARAALVYDEETACLAKQHNNANIIALGGRTTSNERAEQIIKAYMNATYESRHQPRIQKISDIEEEET
ncbi:MAG: ribose 5-phosphate isomerase B [Acholeplasmataceae bacterium]|nr:MAG: ribose 5-phosphate isomerase B [Acholeplasmataceae bacterium]